MFGVRIVRLAVTEYGPLEALMTTVVGLKTQLAEIENVAVFAPAGIVTVAATDAGNCAWRPIVAPPGGAGFMSVTVPSVMLFCGTDEGFRIMLLIGAEVTAGTPVTKTYPANPKTKDLPLGETAKKSGSPVSKYPINLAFAGSKTSSSPVAADTPAYSDFPSGE